jgi:sec-independent protein translocase protein TatB
MFGNLGWGELLVLAVLGLLLFGPDRLPKAAADAARLLRQLRGMARNATADLRAELGPEMADLDLASLHPRRILSSALFDDGEPGASPAASAPTSASAVPAGWAAHPIVPMRPGERPPFDSDAT